VCVSGSLFFICIVRKACNQVEFVIITINFIYYKHTDKQSIIITYYELRVETKNVYTRNTTPKVIFKLKLLKVPISVDS
jgi:hypothetical protein